MRGLQVAIFRHQGAARWACTQSAPHEGTARREHFDPEAIAELLHSERPA